MPGLVKIGSTGDSPKQRAQDIYYNTGVPLPFRVIHERETANCSQAEEGIRNQLGEFRVNPRREFFALSVEEAKRVVDSVCVVVK